MIDSAHAADRKSGRVFYRYKVVSGDDANGPPLTVLLDEDGNPLEMTSERESDAFAAHRYSGYQRLVGQRWRGPTRGGAVCAR